MLVAGDGPFARTLAQVLSAGLISLVQLAGAPKPNEIGANPLLDDLETVFLVMPETMSAPEALWHHHALWKWVQTLTRARNYHELGVVFVHGEDQTGMFEIALANGLGLERFNPAQGFMFWDPAEPLRLLLNRLRVLTRTDAETVNDRQSSQPKRRVLVQLKEAISTGEQGPIVSAAQQVNQEFKDDLHRLDNYCQPPCHPNGNAWRSWLKAVVMEGVTLTLQMKAQQLLPTLNI